MPPAIIGGVIAGAATIGGGLLASSSSKKAANQASDAQVNVANQNNALTREIYNRNTGNFTPYMQSGTRANSLLDSFIYGGNVQQPQQMQPQGFAPQGGFPQNAFNGGGGYSQPSYIDGGGYFGDEMQGNYQPLPNGTSYAQPQGAITTQAPTNAMSGYDAFVASPYYQNPLAEGFRALNHGLASSGRLESGDAYKRAIRYGQDYGAGRQDEYLNLVGTQANRGFGAASALAGVGQNMVNNITANNQGAADAISNAALIRGQANNSLYNSIGSGLGMVVGGLGSSYKW